MIIQPTKPETKTVLVDGDTLVYRCGFASDYSAKRLKIESEPIEEALSGVRASMEQILYDCNSTDYMVFIGGRDNFRYYVDSEYKANRRGNKKPTHYKAIRDYLVEEWGAIVVNFIEADDAIGIMHKPDGSTIIATIDKDMKQLGGLYYNITTRIMDNISPRDANLFLHYQMLVGDSVDNIKGVKSIGDKRATELLDGIQNFTQARDIVAYAYCYDWERLAKNEKLLRMLR